MAAQTFIDISELHPNFSHPVSCFEESFGELMASSVCFRLRFFLTYQHVTGSVALFSAFKSFKTLNRAHFPCRH